MAVGLSLPVYAIRAVPMGALERSLRYERVGIIEVLDLSVFNAVAVATSIAGVGLVGFTRSDRCVVYAGPGRFGV